MFASAARRQMRQILKSLEGWIQHLSSQNLSHMHHYRPKSWAFCFNLNCYTQAKRETFRCRIYSSSQEGRLERPDLGGMDNSPGSAGEKLDLSRSPAGKDQISEDDVAIIDEQLEGRGIDKRVEFQPSLARLSSCVVNLGEGFMKRNVA